MFLSNVGGIFKLWILILFLFFLVFSFAGLLMKLFILFHVFLLGSLIMIVAIVVVGIVIASLVFLSVTNVRSDFL